MDWIDLAKWAILGEWRDSARSALRTKSEPYDEQFRQALESLRRTRYYAEIALGAPAARILDALTEDLRAIANAEIPAEQGLKEWGDRIAEAYESMLNLARREVK